MKRWRICLVGATHPSQNPRLVREADILTEAGHQVRVVAPCFVVDLAERDAVLMRRRQWRLEQVDFRPLGATRLRSAILRGRRRLAGKFFLYLKNSALAHYSYALAGPELLKLAAREPADWFIAHTQAALPIAAEAARRWNAQLGFDCEDLLAHSVGEPKDIVSAIEAEYVPQCTYISTASLQMAEQLSRDHGTPTVLVLYNVFPSAMAEGLRPPSQRPDCSTVRLHWFGQTIGPGRGLEEAVEALRYLDGVELHLRGQFSDGYRPNLETLAADCGVMHRLFFLPSLDHDDLINSMEPFDVGLALERKEDSSYSRTVTNKFFSYLLAGLAIAATDTPGQREVLAQIPAAGFLYPSGNSRVLAEGLLEWLRNREKLRTAQQAAWDAARARFCWDCEAEKFLQLFEPSATPEGVLAGEGVAR